MPFLKDFLVAYKRFSSFCRFVVLLIVFAFVANRITPFNSLRIAWLADIFFEGDFREI